MKLRYIGQYDGIEPRTGRMCKQGEVYDFPEDVVEALVSSGQFEKVSETPEVFHPTTSTGGE